jgi:fission 1 protein
LSFIKIQKEPREIIITMGTTSKRQKEAKAELDRKLSMSAPSRQLLEELAVACTTDHSQNATFQYAFALSKSTEPSELRYAVTILDGLVLDGYEHQVDCMYGAATALYLLGDYEDARVRGNSVQDFSPSNTIARQSARVGQITAFMTHLSFLAIPFE